MLLPTAVVFRYVLLGLLRDSVPQHGYALMKAYRDRVGLKVSTANFYRELQRLVREGLVRNVARPGESDPRRAPYRITEAGLASFETWFADPGSGGASAPHEDQLSARVMFLGDVAPEAAEHVLAYWQDELWVRAKLLERSRSAALSGRSASPPDFPTMTLLLGRRMRHVAADLAFVDELATTYRSWLEERRTAPVPTLPAAAARSAPSLRASVAADPPPRAVARRSRRGG